MSRYKAAATVALFTLMANCGAHAADLVVIVRTAKGAPIADAVVTAETSSKPPMPSHFEQPLRMAQHNLQFDPFVLLAPVGAEIAFPNQDPVHHQVYSFSPAKQFNLRLYGHDERRSVHFDRAGTVAVGCNIHDSMSAFIRIVDTPFAAKTDIEGRATLHSLPAGSAIVVVWRPYLKAPNHEERAEVLMPPNGEVQEAFTAEVSTPPMKMTAY